ncbi:Phage regulatory protein Rha [compost metagenome]
MSSQEIAELVGSQHGHVKVSIERLMDRGVIQTFAPRKIQKTPGAKAMEAYIFSGEQGKRDSIIVVAQLSPEFTAKLVDRWQELEVNPL